MEKIPTAEELLISKRGCIKYGKFFDYVEDEDLIEFAKLHVKAALQAAAENAKHLHSACDSDFKIDKQSILDSYSEDLIK